MAHGNQQKLTPNNGNQGKSRVVKSDSDDVRGVSPKSTIPSSVSSLIFLDYQRSHF